MTEKLSFQGAQGICQALGRFAEARSGAEPDKDLILIVKKIDGREQLETTRLSEMSWLSRMVRWFGFGGATLSSVASYLQAHEPYLPRYFVALQNRNLIILHYNEEDVDQVMQLDKDTYKELKKQKIRGCEIFKRCLTHHNQSHGCKVHILLQEDEKVDLNAHGQVFHYGVSETFPNPISEDSVDKMRVCYKAPVLDPEEFGYLKPFFKHNEDKIPNKVLGFCYEHGLGVKPDLIQAVAHYRPAVAQNEYSACHNLGRLLLKRGDAQEAIDVLEKGEKLLVDKITQAQQVIDNAKAQHPNLANTQELERINSARIQQWQKVVDKIRTLLMAAYQELNKPNQPANTN